MKNEVDRTFPLYFNRTARRISKDNYYQRFWDQPVEAGEVLVQAMKLALVHSEISEALEAIREETPQADKHLPERSAEEVELADAVIRIMDYAGHFNLDVGGAIIDKMHYNRTRQHKHGKRF